MSTRLQRTAFTTDRALEFFSEAELTMQLGYSRSAWALVLVKELVDNALDAAEGVTSPEIRVTLEADAISVQDNGPGLPAATIEKSLDYQVRVSDKKHYISPTRGQLGNALKCVWAAPFVAHSKGRVEVTACGLHHDIHVDLDRISQKPRISHRTNAFVQTGTFVKVHWPGLAGSLASVETFGLYEEEPFAVLLKALVTRFSAFNPHSGFFVKVPGEKPDECAAAVKDWQKWRPNEPTSPHWYSPDLLSNLVAAYLHHGPSDGSVARTVQRFIGEFAGLTRSESQKRVAQELGLAGQSLTALVTKAGDLNLKKITRLVEVMQKQSRPIQPQRLGVIGKEHLFRALEAGGAIRANNSFRYARKLGTTETGLPFIIEVAFGIGEELPHRQLVLGLNHSPTLKVFSDDLDDLLNDCQIQSEDPVILVVHQVCPHFEFDAHGKGSMVPIPEMVESLAKAIHSATKEFMKAKRRSLARARQNRISQEEMERLARGKQKDQIRAAAFAAMPEAYQKVSDHGRLPANARQLMYAVRPMVLEATGGKCWRNSAYFTQKLWPDYQAEHPDETATWDVVYDARGHFQEPHSSFSIELGTLGVRAYIARWKRQAELDLMPVVALRDTFPTNGPRNRYRYALFLEKEGFDPLLEKSRIRDRYDVGLFSSKGLSTTATRALVEALSNNGVTILVVHDFDKAGFTILHTLRRSNQRYTFSEAPNVIDLGLRLDDVKRMRLPSEPVYLKQTKEPRIVLSEYGATAEEQEFLAGTQHGNYWKAERVELNAMTSRQFIDWLEGKLKKHGAKKILPDQETLESAWRRAQKIQAIRKLIAKVEKKGDWKPAPTDLRKRLAARLKELPIISWDGALAGIALREK